MSVVVQFPKKFRRTSEEIWVCQRPPQLNLSCKMQAESANFKPCKAAGRHAEVQPTPTRSIRHTALCWIAGIA